MVAFVGSIWFGCQFTGHRIYRHEQKAQLTGKQMDMQAQWAYDLFMCYTAGTSNEAVRLTATQTDAADFAAS